MAAVDQAVKSSTTQKKINNKTTNSEEKHAEKNYNSKTERQRNKERERESKVKKKAREEKSRDVRDNIVKSREEQSKNIDTLGQNREGAFRSDDPIEGPPARNWNQSMRTQKKTAGSVVIRSNTRRHTHTKKKRRGSFAERAVTARKKRHSKWAKKNKILRLIIDGVRTFRPRCVRRALSLSLYLFSPLILTLKNPLFPLQSVDGIQFQRFGSRRWFKLFSRFLGKKRPFSSQTEIVSGLIILKWIVFFRIFPSIWSKWKCHCLFTVSRYSFFLNRSADSPQHSWFQ